MGLGHHQLDPIDKLNKWVDIKSNSFIILNVFFEEFDSVETNYPKLFALFKKKLKNVCFDVLRFTFTLFSASCYKPTVHQKVE